MFTSEITNLIYVEEAPTIPGLTFRGFRGETDFPKMEAVLLKSKETDQIEDIDTAEDLARRYNHLVNCDPYRDMLFAEMDGEVVGYSRVYWFEEVEGNRIYIHFGNLSPEWRRRGIGRAMLRYNQQRLREISDTHPDNTPRFFESFAADTEHAATALLLNEGYTAVRHFYIMVRPNLDEIPDAPMPEGLEVRPVEMEHLPAICEAAKEAFRDHWGFSEEMEPTVEQMKDNRNFDPSLWRVAWEGDQVAGMVLSFIDPLENEKYNRKRGWTENICVRRPWRKRGLARSLIVQSLQAVKERGMTQAALGVDTQNLSGALRLYEGIGFRPVKRFTNYQKALK